MRGSIGDRIVANFNIQSPNKLDLISKHRPSITLNNFIVYVLFDGRILDRVSSCHPIDWSRR